MLFKSATINIFDQHFKKIQKKSPGENIRVNKFPYLW